MMEKVVDFIMFLLFAIATVFAMILVGILLLKFVVLITTDTAQPDGLYCMRITSGNTHQDYCITPVPKE